MTTTVTATISHKDRIKLLMWWVTGGMSEIEVSAKFASNADFFDQKYFIAPPFNVRAKVKANKNLRLSCQN
jgi:hypothetical protein